MERKRKQMLLGLAMPGTVLLVVLLIGAVYLAWPGDYGEEEAGSFVTPADPTDTVLVAEGRQIYMEHCASCHGENLEGETEEWRTRKESGSLPAPPHDPTGHTWHHPDQQLFAITKHGIEPFAPEGYVSEMPAFGDVLTDREIWAVLAYIKSTWPPETLRMQEERTEQAARAEAQR